MAIRTIVSAVGGGIACAVVLSAGAALLLGRVSAFAENGFLETLQMGLWGASGVLAIAAVEHVSRRERAALYLFAVAALFCALREGDFGRFLGPAVLHSWGIRFTAKWWLSFAAPIVPKLVAAAVGIAILAGVLALVRRMRPPAAAYLRLKTPPSPYLYATSLVIVLAAIADGFVPDPPSGSALLALEETLDSAAPLIFLAAVFSESKFRNA